MRSKTMTDEERNVGASHVLTIKDGYYYVAGRATESECPSSWAQYAYKEAHDD